MASCSIFKTVDSKDTVVKATGMYLRRILKTEQDATCNEFIAMLIYEVTEDVLRLKSCASHSDLFE